VVAGLLRVLGTPIFAVRWIQSLLVAAEEYQERSRC
jgi:hypothetical protein